MIPEKKDFIHPEQHILLLSGEMLPAYEKRSSSVLAKERELLLKHAFFLWEQRARILSDSKLFLTPIPIDNRIVHHTRHGSDKPTLGILVEWWQYVREFVFQTDEQGQEWLIFEFQGHYLTGRNRCKAVNRVGEQCKIQLPHFTELWTSFYKLHKLYEEPQEQYKSYDLAQAVELLRED